MQREEVVRRLRLMNQPVTYFGESDEERQRRLHQIELIVSERQQGSSAGAQKNIFQLMNESVEAEIEAAMAAGDDADESNSDDEATAQNGARSQGPIGASGSAAGSLFSPSLAFFYSGFLVLKSACFSAASQEFVVDIEYVRTQCLIPVYFHAQVMELHQSRNVCAAILAAPKNLHYATSRCGICLTRSFIISLNARLLLLHCVPNNFVRCSICC